MSLAINVSDHLSVDHIIDLKAKTKHEAISELIDVLKNSDKVHNVEEFEKAIWEREKLMSTGIGYEVAIPHARVESLDDFVIAVGRCNSGIEYESIDNKPVKLIFLIGASPNQDKDYIKLLSRLVLRLKNDNLKKKILKAKDATEIYNLINKTK